MDSKRCFAFKSTGVRKHDAANHRLSFYGRKGSVEKSIVCNCSYCAALLYLQNPSVQSGNGISGNDTGCAVVQQKKSYVEGSGVLAVLAALVFRTEKFQEFLFSFSLKNTDEFATTGCVFSNEVFCYRKCEIMAVLGLGYLDGAAATAAWWGHITDIGLAADRIHAGTARAYLYAVESC